MKQNNSNFKLNEEENKNYSFYLISEINDENINEFNHVKEIELCNKMAEKEKEKQIQKEKERIIFGNIDSHFVPNNVLFTKYNKKIERPKKIPNFKFINFL